MFWVETCDLRKVEGKRDGQAKGVGGVEFVHVRGWCTEGCAREEGEEESWGVHFG